MINQKVQLFNHKKMNNKMMIKQDNLLKKENQDIKVFKI